METSKVYFTNLRTTPSSNLLDKMERLVKRAGITNIDFQNQFVAIKIHFGEPGNLAYIRPNYAARIATLLRGLGAKPFLTDCNTLYSGRRANAVDHLESAMENGFNPISAKCDVIIADGLKGTEYREIEIDGEYCKAPKIGSAIADADIVITMNHFKGHEQTGFGGALKNLGMGCASVGGKLELHSVGPVEQVDQREADRRGEEAVHRVQHRVPEREDLIERTDLAKNLGREHEHQHDDFQHRRQLDAELHLDERRRQQQQQRQDAQEHIFVVAVKELEYCHGEHQHAQYHIDRE